MHIHDVTEPIVIEIPNVVYQLLAVHHAPLVLYEILQDAEFLEGEWLDQIIIGADVQGGDLVFGGAARGEYYDRRGDAMRPHVAADLVAVLLGQHQVQDYKVVILVPDLYAPLRGLAIQNIVDRVTLLLQTFLQRLGQLFLVLDYQYAHGLII